MKRFSAAESLTGDSVRERLLLHWVNSLPLTKCLLVEELIDLRFGDILHEIVELVKHISTEAEAPVNDEKIKDNVFECDTIVERIRRVVQFVAKECRSQDEDAIFIVNDTECVSRVMMGERDAICAVLTVLKRLSVMGIAKLPSYKANMESIQRRHAQEKMIQSKSIGGHLEADQQSKGSQGRLLRSRLSCKQSKNTMLTVTKVERSLKENPQATKQSGAVNIPSTDEDTSPNLHDDNICVCDNIDSTVTGQPAGKRSSSTDPQDENSRATRFCSWARFVLHVEMPLEQIFLKHSDGWTLFSPKKVRQIFADGILLSRIATSIVLRYGDQLNDCMPTVKKILAVNTSLGRRRHISLVLSLFKSLGISSKAFITLKRLHCPGTCLPLSIWCALDEIVSKVERLNFVLESPNNTDGLKVQGIKNISVCDEREAVDTLNRSRSLRTRIKFMETKGVRNTSVMPFITRAQIHGVNEWLASAGFDITKTSSKGILQDPMRNGVLLCTILVQVLKCAPFSYFKTPRTLTEMRENISKALKRLRTSSLGYIPPCYLTLSGEQSILTGDRQILYGILVHMWKANNSASESEKSQKNAQVGKLSLNLITRPRQPSPLLLDIPAVTLASQGLKSSTASCPFTPNESFDDHLTISGNDSNAEYDDDDLFPIPETLAPSPNHFNELNELSPESNLDTISHDLSSTNHTIDCEWTQVSSRSVNEELSGRLGSCAASTPTVESAGKEGKYGCYQVCPMVRSQTTEKKLITEPPQEHVTEILDWLDRLGIHLKTASALYDRDAILTEFQSGVLLCCIVEKVELMRSISGVTHPSDKQPLSKASALHNVTKALKILQLKKTMPLHLLRRARAIYSGDRNVILSLLSQIRKAYGHHHVMYRRDTTRKTNQNCKILSNQRNPVP